MFKNGDCIEVSGRKVGIVTKVTEQTFWMNRLIYSTGLGWFLNPDEVAYSNDAETYENMYWIKVVSAPNEYTTMDAPVLS